MDELRAGLDDQTRTFIEQLAAYGFKNADFQLIQDALMEREDMVQNIEKARIYPVNIGSDLLQPRRIQDFQKQKMLKYADWHCAVQILAVISKHINLYSKGL